MRPRKFEEIPESGREDDRDDAIARSGPVRVTERERSADLAIGDVIDGKYQVEGILGSGGMGFVVAAKHIQLDEYVALKFLHDEFLTQAGIVERFTREARAACKIKSEYVARVYDVGSNGGKPFLVMEHLVGRDLATVLKESGRLGVDDAVEYTMQTCAALASAHAQGIVHRDIKPENLFLVEHDGLPSVKLLDFGISKVALTGIGRGLETSNLTGALTLGTPLYMSPEQIRSSASADSRSDLWSLGMVLYELLTATAAFKADGVAEVCAAVLEQEPRPLHEACPDVPTELADVVMRCLQKDPARRFQSAGELAVALLPFAPHRALAVAERAGLCNPSASLKLWAPASGPVPSQSRTSDRAVVYSVSPTTQRSAREALAARPARPHPLLLAAAVSVVFGAAVGGGLAYRVLTGARGDSARPPAAATALPKEAEPRAAAPPPVAVPLPVVAPAPVVALAPVTETAAPRPGAEGPAATDPAPASGRVVPRAPPKARKPRTPPPARVPAPPPPAAPAAEEPAPAPEPAPSTPPRLDLGY
jgi:serine/threonine protein kinase